MTAVIAILAIAAATFAIRYAWLLDCSEKDNRELRERIAWLERPGVKGAATKKAYQRASDPILMEARNG